MHRVHLFVYFARVNSCPFSLPLAVGGRLRLVIVALPGLFYYFFSKSVSVGKIPAGKTKLALYQVL